MEPNVAPTIDYNAVLADLEKKRDDLDKAIVGIKILMGLPATASGAAVTTAPSAQSEAELDSHAFFGMNIATGAHKYLSIRKKPATAAEIADALIKGGFPSQSDAFGNTVTTALTRNQDTFVKVKRGTWGLKAWYPNYRHKDDKAGES